MIKLLVNHSDVLLEVLEYSLFPKTHEKKGASMGMRRTDEAEVSYANREVWKAAKTR